MSRTLKDTKAVKEQRPHKCGKGCSWCPNNRQKKSKYRLDKRDLTC